MGVASATTIRVTRMHRMTRGEGLGTTITHKAGLQVATRLQRPKSRIPLAAGGKTSVEVGAPASSTMAKTIGIIEVGEDPMRAGMAWEEVVDIIITLLAARTCRPISYASAAKCLVITSETVLATETPSTIQVSARVSLRRTSGEVSSPPSNSRKNAAPSTKAS